MYYHSAELLPSADMHTFFSSHLTTHTANTLLPWHTLLGNVVAWEHKHDPPLRQIPTWSDKTTIYQACRQCLGLRDFKGGLGGGGGSPEERGVSLHGQGRWGSAWREEGFGPHWDLRDGSVKGRGSVPKPLWPGLLPGPALRPSTAPPRLAASSVTPPGASCLPRAARAEEGQRLGVVPSCKCRLHKVN